MHFLTSPISKSFTSNYHIQVGPLVRKNKNLHIFALDRLSENFRRILLHETEVNQMDKLHTSFLSFRFVSMTTVATFCSHIILQKSATVSSFGPEK